MFTPFDKHIDRSSRNEEFLKMVDASLDPANGNGYLMISGLSSVAALLNWFLDDVMWVGFYLTDDENHRLVLGPFQGDPACTLIPWGTGVCGTAAKEAKTQLVADVNAFPGHIACSSASQSELVVPVIANGKVVGVIDIDSASKNRFDEQDAALVGAVAMFTAERLFE